MRDVRRRAQRVRRRAPRERCRLDRRGRRPLRPTLSSAQRRRVEPPPPALASRSHVSRSAALTAAASRQASLGELVVGGRSARTSRARVARGRGRRAVRARRSGSAAAWLPPARAGCGRGRRRTPASPSRSSTSCHAPAMRLVGIGRRRGAGCVRRALATRMPPAALTAASTSATPSQSERARQPGTSPPPPPPSGSAASMLHVGPGPGARPAVAPAAGRGGRRLAAAVGRLRRGRGRRAGAGRGSGTGVAGCRRGGRSPPGAVARRRGVERGSSRGRRGRPRARRARRGGDGEPVRAVVESPGVKPTATRVGSPSERAIAAYAAGELHAEALRFSAARNAADRGLALRVRREIRVERVREAVAGVEEELPRSAAAWSNGRRRAGDDLLGLLLHDRRGSRRAARCTARNAAGTGRSVPAICSGAIATATPGGSPTPPCTRGRAAAVASGDERPDARTTSVSSPVDRAPARTPPASSARRAAPICTAARSAPRGGVRRGPSTTSSTRSAVSVHWPPFVRS